MEYSMEELTAVVGGLARKYLAGESTSMTYERAEQLMGAVLYCIHEAECADGGAFPVRRAGSAREMYEAGLRCVEERTKQALARYHRLLVDFEDYGNLCLHDTVLRGLPEFFRWYDIRFAPQETILTLDYPVLRDLTGLTGIDRIDGFLACIAIEQRFLRGLPREYVQEALRRYDERHWELTENLCEMVLSSVIESLLAAGDEEKARTAVVSLINKACAEPEEALPYLERTIDGIFLRLRERR